jgi:hypothetical protein
MGNPHADGVVITIGPNSSVDLSVSAMTAQKIVTICHVSVYGIASDVNVDDDKSGKIDDGQNENGNKYVSGAFRKAPS